MAASRDIASTPDDGGREVRWGIEVVQDVMVDARPGGRKGWAIGGGDAGGESIFSREETDWVDETDALVDVVDDISTKYKSEMG